MSLESGSFIKDLVSTNPEGTDPKSQGDDHLRLIKAVLKSQFSGFTLGKPIGLSEDMINFLGGAGSSQGAANLDVVMGYTRIIGINSGMTGNLPPGWLIGDMCLNIAYSSTIVYQVYFTRASGATWTRQFVTSAWTSWIPITPIGVNQAWTGVTRVIGTTYVNDTGRPIMVSACINGVGGTVGATASATVSSVQISTVCINDSIGASFVTHTNTLTFIVPAGASYAITTTVATTVAFWRELR